VAAERTTPCSLANVLRLRRPFVVVDEAHNSRTELAFDMLARFRPSGVMELTATPDLERTPSNVLHSVSAAELKVEEMIKLPVVLETEPNWQQCLWDTGWHASTTRSCAQRSIQRARRSPPAKPPVAPTSRHALLPAAPRCGPRMAALTHEGLVDLSAAEQDHSDIGAGHTKAFFDTGDSQ
jgi:hypothetical protein